MADDLTYGDVFGSKKPQVEPGAYDARLTAIEVRTNTKDGSKFRSWIWDASGIRISDSTSLAMGSESKAYEWATAMLGREPKAGESLTDCIGKWCLLVVTLKESGFPKVKVMPARPGVVPDAQIVAEEPLTF